MHRKFGTADISEKQIKGSKFNVKGTNNSPTKPRDQQPLLTERSWDGDDSFINMLGTKKYNDKLDTSSKNIGEEYKHAKNINMKN